MVQAELVDDCRNVVGPCPRLRIVLLRFRRFRHAMPAKVKGYEAERVRKLALVLSDPAQVILRPSMDEQDGGSIGFAPFAHVQLQAASASHRMYFHLDPPFADLLNDRRSALEELLLRSFEMSGLNVGIVAALAPMPSEHPAEPVGHWARLMDMKDLTSRRKWAKAGSSPRRI